MELLSMRRSMILIFLFSIFTLYSQDLKINESGYFETQGLNVIVLNDIYPEGHQGGVTIIQHGERVVANGNVTLQQTPGQWQPYPRLLKKDVDTVNNIISARLMFPDSNRVNAQNQPIIYPDFEFEYKLRISTEGNKILVNVDLDEPLPDEWVGKVGFYFDIYPGAYFGKSYWMDGKTGYFPRYANSPVELDSDQEYEAVPMARGQRLVISPEDKLRMITFENRNGDLILADGRVKHNNGWFVVRSVIPGNMTKNAVQWVITPNIEENWLYKPVVHISQVGYHPKQSKLAIIELDRNDMNLNKVELKRVLPDGNHQSIMTLNPTEREKFLRYDYLTADFTSVTEPGLYIIEYGESRSNIFEIKDDIYYSGTWQPTLEYFLPVQMCHMRVFEKYRVWHDRCHLDDALMAPEDIRHFDGYRHGKVPEGFEPLQHVEGLNRGGSIGSRPSTCS